jgi:hypothetical protein
MWRHDERVTAAIPSKSHTVTNAAAMHLFFFFFLSKKSNITARTPADTQKNDMSIVSNLHSSSP